jgi:hypothetical protein
VDDRPSDVGIRGIARAGGPIRPRSIHEAPAIVERGAPVAIHIGGVGWIVRTMQPCERGVDRVIHIADTMMMRVT